MAYSRVTEETTVFGATPTGGKIVTEFDLDPTTGTTREQPWLICPDCETNPVLFNLSHDFRQGNLKKQEVYNQSNQLISRTEIQYTANGGIKYDSTYAVRYYNSSYSFPGFSGNYAMTKSYYILFKKFRVQSQTTTTFSPNGSGIPTISSINSTYKDEMPLAYREKYKRFNEQGEFQ